MSTGRGSKQAVSTIDSSVAATAGAEPVPEAILTVRDVSLMFGRVQALRGVSVAVERSEILALIGPNGAGKTSLLNCINGFYRPSRGSVEFAGRDINKLPPYRRAKLGIARTFQSVQLYLGMTVLDNVLAGRHIHMRTNVLTAALRRPWALREEVANRRRAEEIIDFLEIEGFRHSIVGSIGYGLRKRVDLARALAMEPRLLLMDEPMAGMNLEEKEDMARFILDIHEVFAIPIVLVEHDMGVVMDIATRINVLDWGRLIASGSPEQIAHDEAVIAAYLGKASLTPGGDQ
jgi:branched-chain amino acid transport system ATP-binding protein